MNERQSYPSDVRDDEWAFVAPYLTLMSETAPQREYPLREVSNDLRYIVRGGISWCMMPNDLQQTCDTNDQAGVHIQDMSLRSENPISKE